MTKDTEPQIEEITMTAQDMKNVCLILLENTAASLFMHHYHEEPIDANACQEMALKIRDVVNKLRELIL